MIAPMIVENGGGDNNWSKRAEIMDSNMGNYSAVLNPSFLSFLRLNVNLSVDVFLKLSQSLESYVEICLAVFGKDEHRPRYLSLFGTLSEYPYNTARMTFHLHLLSRFKDFTLIRPSILPDTTINGKTL